MGKLRAFVRLDFMTVKPYFTSKNMLIYIALAVYMAIMSKNIGTPIGIGLMIATLNIGYPFALGEKCNIDALYTTLGADRKTVVRGRYIFSLLLNVCAIVFVTVFSLIALTFTSFFGDVDGILMETLGTTMAIASLFLIVQSMQITMFFKFGYAKAKFFSILPFFIISAFVAFFVMNAQGRGMPAGLNAFVWGIINNGWAVLAIILAILAAVIFVSYQLSLAFYKKREF